MDELLACVEVVPEEEPVRSAILLLHGLGADGHDLEPLVPYLELDGLGVRVILPHAPPRAVTINMGLIMPAWYDIREMSLRREVDGRGIVDSADRIRALVRREVERGVPCERIVLAGFSQGGAVTLQTGLRYPKKLAGLMALSTYLPLAESLPAEGSPANRQTPIFMAHGVYDNVIPMMMGAGSMTFLTGMGHPVEWHQYPMQHSVCPQEIQDIGAWLRKILKA